MKFSQRMRLRDQSTVRVLPQEQPAIFIRWRDEWRAEAAAALRGEASDNGFAKPKSTVLQRPARPDRSEAAKFATAIARDEFGRFYWNGKLARQLAQALAARPQGRRTGASKPAGRQR
jgi:hypothetical protein